MPRGRDGLVTWQWQYLVRGRKREESVCLAEKLRKCPCLWRRDQLVVCCSSWRPAGLAAWRKLTMIPGSGPLVLRYVCIVYGVSVYTRLLSISVTSSQCHSFTFSASHNCVSGLASLASRGAKERFSLATHDWMFSSNPREL